MRPTNALGQDPPVRGLVLAGGYSTRMGQDKGLINWHGKPQREYLVELLEGLGLPTCISCRPEQVRELPGFNLVVDVVANQGPLGAIFSAFSVDPEAAWLVVACDMPDLDTATLEYLLDHRRPELAGTAFRAPAFDDDSPDPLCAIWEPASFSVVKQRLEADRRCARKALRLAGVHLLDPPNPDALRNVNTPEERSGRVE